MRTERIKSLARRHAKPPKRNVYVRMRFDPAATLRPALDYSKTVQRKDLGKLTKLNGPIPRLYSLGLGDEFVALLNQHRLEGDRSPSYQNILEIWIETQAQSSAEEGYK